MGQRTIRYKKEKIKKSLRQSPSTNSPAQVTAEEKNDTIEEFDFFGFSPKIYWRDLQRTGLATIVVSAVFSLYKVFFTCFFLNYLVIDIILF